jgi:pyrophosphatase PpaX
MFDHVVSVLFDLDGTVVDTVDLILAAHAHAFRQHLAGPGPPPATIIGNMGRSLAAALGEYAMADGQTEADRVVAEMLRTYRAFQRDHYERLMRPVDGMDQALTTLTERGYVLGVVTSKVEWMARLTLGHYDLERFFPIGVFHDDTVRHKPEPDPLLEAARRGGFSPARAVYVGDSTHDIRAGRAAGMGTVAALWGPYEREDLEREGPDALAEAPSDLLALLGDAAPSPQAVPGSR